MPGIGAYLQTAASQGNLRAVTAGIVTLVLTIILLDQFIWRPVLAWAEKFKLETVANEQPPESWLRDMSGALLDCWSFAGQGYWSRLANGWTAVWAKQPAIGSRSIHGEAGRRRRLAPVHGSSEVLVGLLAFYGTYEAGAMLRHLPWNDWASIGLGVLATLARGRRGAADRARLDHPGRRGHRHEPQVCQYRSADGPGGGIGAGDRPLSRCCCLPWCECRVA